MCDQKTFDDLYRELQEASRDYERQANRLANLGSNHPQRTHQLSEVELAAARHDALVTAAEIVGLL